MADINLIQGDDSAAFGQSLIRISLRDPDNVLENHTISKCEIRFNACVAKVIENPVFPLIINLTSEESNQLSSGNNRAYFSVWDENGRKLTAEGSQVVVIGSKRV